MSFVVRNRSGQLNEYVQNEIVSATGILLHVLSERYMQKRLESRRTDAMMQLGIAES